MRKTLLTIAFALLFGSAGWAQVDAQKLDNLCHAIAKAEGFYIKGTIPNRYANPGDLKAGPTPLPGQRKVGKAGHIVFVNAEAGWAALREYLTGIAEGRRKHYVASMTLAQVSRVYAQQWRPWLRIVTKELAVPTNTKLQELLKPVDVEEDVWPTDCLVLDYETL